IVGSDPRTRARNHHRGWDQALHRVRHGRHHGIDDLGMAEQQVLDLLRIYVLPAATEHVVDAAAEIEEPVLVPAECISRVQPAVRTLGAADLKLVLRATAGIGGSHEEPAFSRLAALPASEPELNLGGGDVRAAARHATALHRLAQRASALGQSVTLRY